MAYQFSCHLSKFQSNDVGGIHAEQWREYRNKENYKNYVDDSRTHLNLYQELTEDGRDWAKHVRQAKEDTVHSTGRKVRKDAVVICSIVETVPPSWNPDVCKDYFQNKAAWYRQFLKDKAGIEEDKLLSMCVHLDESAPHATFVFVPEKDGRLQANNIVNKVFLKQLQAQSQQYSFDWIEKYNSKHEYQLEKMEPYVEGSTRKHLQEQEYKQKKISENIEKLEEKQANLTKKVSDTERQHAEVSEKLDSAKEELQQTQRQTSETIKAGIAAQHAIQQVETKQAAVEIREKNVERREHDIVAYTASPDFKTYKDVREENENLKRELSWKDELIERLQEQNKKLKETLDSWRVKIQKIGSKMAHALGFKDEEYADGRQSEYPDADVKKAYEEAIGEVRIIDPKLLRILPDREHEGMFVLASKQADGQYKNYESGFRTRSEAEQQRRELSDAKRTLDREHIQERSERLTR